jgi:hypothetical protein
MASEGRYDGGGSATVAQNGTVVLLYGSTGAKYHVTVKTPPSNPPETCTISHGEGSITSSNVTDVLVTCSEKTFNIQVTVAGLAGSGLSLCENYTDGTCASAVPITKDGDTLISSALADGVSYLLVFAGGQPTSPWQTCSFIDGSSDGTKAGGTIRGADVTVAVTCTTNKYSIGGTISGLKGNGLKLSLVGQDDLTLTPEASSFAFPGQIDSGSPYTISIAAQAQPTNPWQTCTVASGTGVVQNQDLYAQVNCVTNSYPVIVNLSGYAGSGLVLSRGNQTIGPISSGSLKVQFPAPVLSGADYTVTVKSQPTGPYQQCTVGYDDMTAASNGGIPNALVTCQTLHAITGRIFGLASAATGTGTGSMNGGAQVGIGSATADAAGSYSIYVLDGTYTGIALKLQDWTTTAMGNPITVTVGGANATGPDFRAIKSICVGQWCPMDTLPLTDTSSYLQLITGNSWNDVWVGATRRDPPGVTGASAWQEFAQWNGTSWTTQRMPISSNQILTLWAAGTSNVWTMTLGGEIMNWNGNSWIPQGMGIYQPLAVWGASASDIWAVGSVVGQYGTMTAASMHWDGNMWSTFSSFPFAFSGLAGVWETPNGSDTWSVGKSGTILHWNSTSKTWTSESSGTTKNLSAVWGFDANHVWAFGESGTILERIGDAWRANTPGNSDLFGAWGSSSTDVWAVGAAGTILHLDESGVWTTQVSNTSKDLHGIWGSGPKDVWVVGSDHNGFTILRMQKP